MSFTLRWLFITILFIAVAIVALLNANPKWVNAFRSMIVIVLPLTTIAAICSTGVKRAFWIGFALAGWLHLFSIMLNYVPPFHNLDPQLADPDDCGCMPKQAERTEALQCVHTTLSF